MPKKNCLFVATENSILELIKDALDYPQPIFFHAHEMEKKINDLTIHNLLFVFHVPKKGYLRQN